LQFQAAMTGNLNETRDKKLADEGARKGVLRPISSKNVRYTTQDVIRAVVREMILPTISKTGEDSTRARLAFNDLNEIFDMNILMAFADSDFKNKKPSLVQKLDKGVRSMMYESVSIMTGQKTKSPVNEITEQDKEDILWKKWNQWLLIYNNSPEQIITHITKRFTEKHVAPDEVNKMGSIFEVGKLYKVEIALRTKEKIGLINHLWGETFVYDHRGWYESPHSEAHRKMVAELEVEFQKSLNGVAPERRDRIAWIWKIAKYMSSRGLFSVAKVDSRQYQISQQEFANLIEQGIGKGFINSKEAQRITTEYAYFPADSSQIQIQCRNIFR